MKKFFLSFFMICMVASFFTSCEFSASTPSAAQVADQAQEQIAQQANSQEEIYHPQYFLERKFVNAWNKYFDKPNITTYVYVVSYGNILGYYVVNGKPISNQSYNTPEDRVELDQGTSGGGNVTREAPAVDGTYGSDPTGIKFLTADGNWVCIGGNISFMYSTQPLSLNVPQFVAKK